MLIPQPYLGCLTSAFYFCFLFLFFYFGFLCWLSMLAFYVGRAARNGSAYSRNVCPGLNHTLLRCPYSQKMI